MRSSLACPPEPAQIHRGRGQGDRPCTFDDLLRVAKTLGLVARGKRAAPEEFSRLSHPALIGLADGGTAVLLEVDDTGDTGTRHMVLLPGNQRPEIWNDEQMADGWRWRAARRTFS